MFRSEDEQQIFMNSELPTYSELIDKADDALFGQVIKNPGHVLQPLLPDWTKAQTSIMKTF